MDGYPPSNPLRGRRSAGRRFLRDESSSTGMTLGLSVIILGVLAVAAPGLYRLSRTLAGVVVPLVPLALGVWFAQRMTGLGGEALLEFTPWSPGLSLDLAFSLDGLSGVFALLICFIGGLVLLYATSYMKPYPRAGSFLGILTGFMAAMLGLVLADNLLLLFVFWELTSITSFLLIGFDHQRESARKAAIQSLLTTGLGGLSLLAGAVLLGIAAETFTISDIDASVIDHAFYPAIVALILIGAFAKSAIFPFHYWLPNAMEAPSPVSALLHSATMVKAGVYLVARLHPALGGTLIWDNFLIAFGGATMLIGAVLATQQDQLKKILAYSTVSSLGTLIMLIGMGAHKAAGYYLLAHALFKGALFLAAGSAIKLTGEKNPERISGALRGAPILAGAGVLAALSMMGMFPFLGFVGKELTLKASLAHPEFTELVIITTTLAAALTVYASLIVGLRPLTGDPAEGVRRAAEPSWRQLAGPVLLALVGLLASVAPQLFTVELVAGMKQAMSAKPTSSADISVAEMLWPPTAATWLSIIALAAGALLYARRALYRRITSHVDTLGAIGPARGYDLSLRGLAALAAGQTRLLQHGDLRGYIRLTMLVAMLVILAGAWRADLLRVPPSVFADFAWLDALLAGCFIAGAVGATLQTTALASIAVLGGVGFTLAILFVVFGAPDVAMTQFAVETLIVIMFVLVVLRLPRYSLLTSRGSRLVDAALGAVFGLLMGALTLGVAGRPNLPEIISIEHAARSVPEGFGRNVVNVILVDFRAIDTLGEIFVLGIAAIGVASLIALKRRGDDHEGQRSVILETGARWILPVMLVFSVIVLLRGHNEPGGGFVGGLLAAAGLALQTLAFSAATVARQLPVSSRTLIGAGLLIALASGIPGAFAYDSYMASVWTSVSLPGFPDPLKLGTPLLFDIGVYFTVLGIALHMIFSLEEALHDRVSGS